LWGGSGWGEFGVVVAVVDVIKAPPSRAAFLLARFQRDRTSAGVVERLHVMPERETVVNRAGLVSTQSDFCRSEFQIYPVAAD
jgi:hypothetical protein